MDSIILKIVKEENSERIEYFFALNTISDMNDVWYIPHIGFGSPFKYLNANTHELSRHSFYIQRVSATSTTKIKSRSGGVETIQYDHVVGFDDVADTLELLRRISCNNPIPKSDMLLALSMETM